MASNAFRSPLHHGAGAGDYVRQRAAAFRVEKSTAARSALLHALVRERFEYDAT
jgi:hypothetical protein